MAPNDDAAIDVGERLARLYRAIHVGTMQGLALCNEALAVEAVGFRLYQGHALGVIVTPWFMNLVRARAPGAAPPPSGERGATQSLSLPAASVDVVIGELEGFGRLDACSLFSPMFDFADAEAARLTAEAVIAALFDDEPREAPVRRPPPAPLDRRTFLRGGVSASREAAGA